MSIPADFQKDITERYVVKKEDYSKGMRVAVAFIEQAAHLMNLKSPYDLLGCINDIEASLAVIKEDYADAYEIYEDAPFRKDTDYDERIKKALKKAFDSDADINNLLEKAERGEFK